MERERRQSLSHNAQFEASPENVQHVPTLIRLTETWYTLLGLIKYAVFPHYRYLKKQQDYHVAEMLRDEHENSYGYVEKKFSQWIN